MLPTSLAEDTRLLQQGRVCQNKKGPCPGGRGLPPKAGGRLPPLHLLQADRLDEPET